MVINSLLQCSIPRLDAEVLLAFVLQQTRTYLHTWPERTVTKEQIAQFNHLLKRRQQGEPIAYLVGQQEFWSLPLQVTPATLIPRPETEVLVQTVLDLPIDHSQVLVVFDLGSGSGAISLALATERPHWLLHGIDRSDAALHVAQANANKLQLQVQWLHSDWLDACAADSCDIIVSNPPYIDPEDRHLQQGDLRFEPRSALVAEHSGLAAIETIIVQSQRCLSSSGWLVFEHGYQQAPAVRDLLASAGFTAIDTVVDLAGHLRVTKACLR